MKTDVGMAAAKVAPPAVVSAATAVGGMTLDKWVMVATLAYIVLQAGWLILKGIWAWQDRRRGLK